MAKRKTKAKTASRPEAQAGKQKQPASESTGWPRWAPIAVYALVTLFLFRKFVFSADMLYGSDTLALGYMARLFFAEALQAGSFPLWNPYLLGGTPFLDSLAGGDSLYPTSLLLLFMEPYRALGWKLVIHVFLAGVFMYGWLRALGTGRGAALVAGLAYLLTPILVTQVYPGGDGKLFVAALAPLAFWMTDRTLEGRGVAWFAGLAATIGVVLLSTHFQMAYFLFGAMGVYAIVRCLGMMRAKSPALGLRRFGLFMSAAVLGAGVSAVQMLPAVDYVTELSRRTATTTGASADEARAYSSSFSLHPEEALSMLVPEFVGNGVSGGAAWAEETYWGRNGLKLSHEYFGITVLLLAGLGLLRRAKIGREWLIGAIGLLAFLFALGAYTPVWRIFYAIMPGVDLFRAPSMVSFLASFAAVTLAGLGLDAVVKGSAFGEGSVKRWSFGLVGFLGLLTVLIATGILQSLWTSVVYSGASERALAAFARLEPFLVQGFISATLLTAAVTALVILFREGRVPLAGLLAGLSLLIGVDLIRVNDSFIQTFDVRTWQAPDANMRFLQAQQQQGEPGRLLSLMPPIGQDVKPALYSIELAGGHHPNDLQRYREVIGMRGGGQPENLLNVPQISQLLNVRYLLWPEAQFGGPPQEGLQPLASTRLQDGRIYSAVYPWNGLPRARLVSGVTVVEEAETVDYMTRPSFDPTTEVVLHEPLAQPLPAGPAQGTVTWVAQENNRLELSVQSDRDALLVVADNWFPAWKATVNGQGAEIYRAYHTLRAVRVPAGQSRVEMSFDAGSLRTGLLLSLLSVSLVVAAVIWGRFSGKRKSDRVA